nr:N(6)-adenine-specific methyltransferase METTL4 isoform X2 [Hydra vulgaris]
MAIVFSGQFGWFVDHSKSISLSVIDSNYTCDPKLFIVNKYGFRKSSLNLFIDESLNKKQQCYELSLEHKKKEKKKNKRKHPLNAGEIRMIEYHNEHVEFISSATKELLCGNKLSFTDKENNFKNLNLCEVYLGKDLHEGFNIVCLEDQIYKNSLTNTCTVVYQNERYLIPPKSSFIVSDFSKLSYLAKQDIVYDLIVIDPPWENKSAKRKKDYTTLPEYDLKKIPVRRLLSKHGIVAIWVTNKPKYIDFVKHQLFVEWGVRVVAHWHWVKVTNDGEFVTDFSSIHKRPYEPLLLGQRENCELRFCEIPERKVICSVPCNIHSRKPPLNFILSSYVPENALCLEMFARNLLPGWLSWGNEVLKFQNSKYFCKNTSMAGAKAKRIVVRLVSMAGTGYFYTTTRNRLKDKLTFLKHDPIVNKHVLFTEQKVVKGEKKTKAGGR